MLAIARVQACAYCGSTLVKEDSVLRTAGSAGAWFDAPGLFTLGETRRVGERRFTPLGHVRYDYGRGFWDEYWGEDGDGREAWVSVDEGDVAWQVPLPRADWPTCNAFRLGQDVEVLGSVYSVTEVDNATCAAFRGQLPEAPDVGETHLFANLSGYDAQIVSAERWDGGEAWFIGTWLDPWQVRRA